MNRLTSLCCIRNQRARCSALWVTPGFSLPYIILTKTEHSDKFSILNLYFKLPLVELLVVP